MFAREQGRAVAQGEGCEGVRECDVEGGVMGELGVGMGLRVTCRRGSMSAGSGRLALRGRERETSREERGVTWREGGGLREERRIGGSKVRVADVDAEAEERWVRRFGEADLGEVVPGDVGLADRGKSGAGKACVVGVSGGVACPGNEDRTMVFLHASQIPSVDLIGPLHVLQMATVVGSAGSCGCCRVAKPNSTCGLPLMEGILGDECGS